MSPDLQDQHERLRSATALQYILGAWEEALDDGYETEDLAEASLFAALSDMVKSRGEKAVIDLARGLADRVEAGEFTLNRVVQ